MLSASLNKAFPFPYLEVLDKGKDEMREMHMWMCTLLIT